MQTRLAAHLRDPRLPPPPDVEDRRLAIYRDLVFRNVEAALESAFPVIRRILADDAWRALARDFFARHACRAPQYNRIAEEFVRFLESERGSSAAQDPPFLAELAHYEWVELALGIAPGEPPLASLSGDGDPLDVPLCASPLAWVLQYAWPVHRIGPDHLPQSPPPEPTFLVVYRNAQDDVRFMELNAVTARLLALVAEQPGITGRDTIARIAAELGSERRPLIEPGRATIEMLADRGIVSRKEGPWTSAASSP